MKAVISRLVKVLVLAALCAASMTTASSHTGAQTPCSQWNVNGDWTFPDSQGGVAQRLTLTQMENVITGSGYSSYWDSSRRDAAGILQPARLVQVKGSVEGTINGNSLELTVQWEKKGTFVYRFKINRQGLIEGYAYKPSNPDAQTNWIANERARCEDENVALAEKGEAIANQDPLALALRNLQPEGPTRRGFDIGMAAAEGNTAPGPGKQRIHDSLLPEEQKGFRAAVSFSLARNKNAKLAATGATIAESDSLIEEARNTWEDPFFKLGFDIATELFGDPAKGAVGNTLLGPGSLGIRSGLNTAGQRGFDAAVKLHFSRKYR